MCHILNLTFLEILAAILPTILFIPKKKISENF